MFLLYRVNDYLGVIPLYPIFVYYIFLYLSPLCLCLGSAGIKGTSHHSSLGSLSHSYLCVYSLFLWVAGFAGLILQTYRSFI